jgi:hypothetical protein
VPAAVRLAWPTAQTRSATTTQQREYNASKEQQRHRTEKDRPTTRAAPLNKRLSGEFVK